MKRIEQQTAKRASIVFYYILAIDWKRSTRRAILAVKKAGRYSLILFYDRVCRYCSAALTAKYRVYKLQACTNIRVAVYADCEASLAVNSELQLLAWLVQALLKKTEQID